MGARHRWLLLAIVGAGIILRLGWAVIGAEEPSYEPLPRDPGFYMVLANRVAEGNGYSYEISHDGGQTFQSEPTAYYPPGYPLSLGALFWLTDLAPAEVSPFGTAVAFNLVLSTATVLLAFVLGRRLADVRVGLLTALVIAAWPNLVVYSGVVLTETLFLFLLLALLAVALPLADAPPPRLRRLVLTGSLLGLVGLVRPTALVVVPAFILLWWRPSEGELRAAVRRTALVGASALLVLSPWTTRNLVRMEAPVLVSTNFGDNLCIGHNPQATGGFSGPIGHPCFEDLYEGPRPRYETERQSETFRRALGHIRAEPTTVFTSMPAKVRYTLGRDTDGLSAASDYGQVDILTQGWRDLLKTASNVYYMGAIVLALAGAAVLARQRPVGRAQVFFLVAVVVQLVPPLLTFGDARFKLPLYPALAFLAAVALAATLAHLRPQTVGSERDEPETSSARASAVLS